HLSNRVDHTMRHGQQQTQANTENRPQAARLRTIQVSRLEQSSIGEFSTMLRPCNPRFIDWYCSEPHLAFNKTVVTRYRMYLEQAHYASSTINLRLAAVRRLAYEAADSGLLSPDLAAGIRRVKGAKKHGVRIGNWLTAEQSKNLLAAFNFQTLRNKRDYAIVAVLLGCGLRRAELATVCVQDLQ